MMRLACVLALSLALAACGGAACPKHLLVDPSEALARHAQNLGTARTLRAEARVDQRSRDGRVKGRVMMFLERPDRVRFDVVTQFGPALILTSDGEHFALSDMKENRYLTGPACASNIARMIGVALSASDVVSVLFGDAPRVASARESLACSGEGGYVLESTAPGGERQVLELEVHEDDLAKLPSEQRLRLVRLQRYDRAGKALWRVSYDDHRRVGEALMPFVVHVEDLRRKADAMLRFTDIDLDVAIPEGAFAQTPRRGLAIEEVSCAD